MPTFRQNYTYNFNIDSKDIYNNLADLRKFGDFHPYMTSVEKLEETPEFTEYLIKEKVTILGFIPVRPEYKSKVYEIEKNKQVRYAGVANGGVELRIDFTITSVATGQTQLDEQIEIKGNSFFARILLKAMNDSHGPLFKKMGALGK